MIVCCGEALIDFIPAGDARDGALYRPVEGGSPYNVALGLGRLDVETAFVGGLSRDAFGNSLAQKLRDNNVRLDWAARLDAPTTLALVTFQDGQPSYAFYDEATAARLWTQDVLPDLPDAVTALHFGSISLLRNPSADAFADLMERHRGRALLSLDPNIRPALIEEEEAVRARIARMAAIADIVKISDEDLDWLSPGRPFRAAAEDLLKSGPACVVVTRGAEGAELVYQSGSVRVAAPGVNVVDTVGAGDSFMAALLARIRETGRMSRDRLLKTDEAGLRDLLGYAVRAAALTCTRPGADPPRRAELAASVGII